MFTRFIKAHRYAPWIQELGELPFHYFDPFNPHHHSVQTRTTMTPFSGQMSRIQRDQIKRLKSKLICHRVGMLHGASFQ